MPIDPEPLWKAEFKDLKPDSGKSGDWATKMAAATDKGVTNKLQLNGVTGSITFTFKKDIFENMLKIAVPAPVPFPGAQAIATAWQLAVLSSTIVVAPGAFVGIPTPPTTFSTVISSLIDPPSIAIGFTTLFGLLSAMAAVPDGSQGVIGPSLRKAFSLLTVTIIGLNSVPPPAGPAPLVAPLTPVM